MVTTFSPKPKRGACEFSNCRNTKESHPSCSRNSASCRLLPRGGVRRRILATIPAPADEVSRAHGCWRASVCHCHGATKFTSFGENDVSPRLGSDPMLLHRARIACKHARALARWHAQVLSSDIQTSLRVVQSTLTDVETIT